MSVSALSSSSSSYWEKMLAQMKGSSESQAQDNLASKLFGDLDSDGDGTLSLSETGLSKDLYSNLDTDGDGTVTQTELQKPSKPSTMQCSPACSWARTRQARLQMRPPQG